MVNTIDGRTETELLAVVEREIKKKTKQSGILSEAAESVVTRLDRREITAGRLLGSGGFCDVKDVEKVSLLSDFSSKKQRTSTKPEPSNFVDDVKRRISKAFSRQSSLEEKKESIISGSITDDFFHDREYMAANYITEDGSHQYAVKVIKASARNDAGSYIRSVMDLAMEARYLAILRHPNIIKMRAMSVTSPYEDGLHFFLILEKLDAILSVRLSSWKQRIPSAFWTCCCGPKASTDFWTERLMVAYDLSTALAYLHDLKVIYRDLKPDNVGFSMKGDVRLFDFGLSREMQRKDMTIEGTYQLTGGTGFPPYIAPEVAQNKPYNESCDVYSFCILLWQILKVETPFGEGLSEKDFQRKVIQGGQRPVLDKRWPVELTSLMQAGWGEDIKKRPSMSDMTNALKDVILEETGSERQSLLEISRLFAGQYV